MELIILLLLSYVVPPVLVLCSLWQVWRRRELVMPTDAGILHTVSAILWAAATAYLFCPALYSTLATASHTAKYNPHIGEIRWFINGWLYCLLPFAVLLPGVLALRSRWHGVRVFGRLAALYAGTVMLLTAVFMGTNPGGQTVSLLLPFLWGWWETLFEQHGWGGTIYDLRHCSYGSMSFFLWLWWISLGSIALFAARFLCAAHAKSSKPDSV